MPAGPPPAIRQVVASGAACRRVRHAVDRRVDEVSGILSWWDGVELWLSGLGFVAQTAVVMPVVLLLAYGVAVLLDGALGNGIRLLKGAPQRRGRAVTGMPRSRVTLVLVILVVLVIVMWLIAR